MYDKYNRKIHYLRISVTDRCNLRCKYCMPEAGINWLKNEQILSLAEIVEVATVAVSLGIDKIRLTGGEPLVRQDILQLVEKIAAIKGLNDFAMTTNGVLLEEMADSLAKAGLKRINISLDTIHQHRFQEITRGGDIQKVFRGIEAAQNAGLNPIKINCVVEKSFDEEDAISVKQFCDSKNLNVRFIKAMSLNNGEFWHVKGGSGGNCPVCNRLRLTADGMMKPCLFNDNSFSIRELGIRNAILLALGSKPEFGSTNTQNKFHNIGG